MQISQSTLQRFSNQSNTSEYKKEILKEHNSFIDSRNNDPLNTEDKVKTALDSFNKIFKPTHLEFQIHRDAGRYFVQIIDDNTQEVIKQIPSEEFLKMVAETKEKLGLIIDIKI